MKRLLLKIWHFFHPPLEIVEFKIPEFSFKLRGAKNKWHHYVCTVSWWEKHLPDKSERLAEVAVFTDGKLKVKTLVDELGHQWVEKVTRTPRGAEHSGEKVVKTVPAEESAA